MKNSITLLALVLCLAINNQLYAKKAAYEGYGKVSTSTGRIKTKSTQGYVKPSNGYKFVNPYSRS